MFTPPATLIGVNTFHAADLPPAPLRPNLRGQWMLAPDITFLNHGSFGATPRAVYEAQNEWRKRIEAEPIELLGRQNFALIAKAKEPIAKWLGVNAADFGFVTNATEGVNAVLRSLDLSPGDELLTTSHVYHAVRQAMRLTTRRVGATLREVEIPLPVDSAEQIARLVLNGISQKTKLLVIDHITSPTALVFPMEQIIEGCRSRGVEVLVDGAHAPGMIPLNVGKLGATYYTANFHKWFCAPKGSAFLWVTPEKQKNVHPPIISHFLDDSFIKEFGWQGTRDISSWLTTPTALEFMDQLGSNVDDATERRSLRYSEAPGLPASNPALRSTSETGVVVSRHSEGWQNVIEHNHAMAVWAHRMLCRRFGVDPISPIDGSLFGSTATVVLPAALQGMTVEQNEALAQRMYSEFRIEVPLVRWNERCHLRVSCQVYNRPEEYEHLADVVLDLARDH